MTRSAGASGEDMAARFLEARGLRVLERNFRCRLGEIDLVCEDAGTLVFVEVRLRSGKRFGSAAESITAAKRARIVRAARHYLAGGPERRCRFDAVLLDGTGHASLEWIRDAFPAE